MSRLAWLLFALVLGAGGSGRLEEGQRAWEAGDAAGALVQWSLALAEAEDEAQRFEALVRLATVNRELGRLGASMDALESAGKVDTGRSRDAPRLDNALGLWHLAAGDPVTAELALSTALEAARRLEAPALAASVANNVGLARLARGDLDGAASRFTDAAALHAALRSEEGRIDALINLGVTLRRQGRWPAARQALEEAVTASQAAGDLARELDAQLDLALVLEDLGQLEEARGLLGDALAAARLRADLDRQGRILLDLASLDQRGGRTAEALSEVMAAEQAFVAVGRPREAAAAALDRVLLQGGAPGVLRKLATEAQEAGDGPLEARVRLNLAGAAVQDAAEQAARALELAETWGLQDLGWQARALVGRLALAAGETERGLAELEAVVQDLERLRGALRDGDERDFLVRHEGVYATLLQARLDADDALGALAWASSLQAQELPTAAPEPLAALQEQEAWLSRQLQTSQGLPERQAALRDQLAQVRVDFAATVDGLRDSHPDWAAAVRIDSRDLEAIQGRLDPGVVVLQAVPLEDRLVLLTFSRDELSVTEVPEADRASVVAAVDGLARVLRLGMALDEPGVLAAADLLGGWLIEPVAGRLRRAKVVVVSAAGPLRQLPFALLRHRGRFLVEDHALVRVTHTGSLLGSGGPRRFQLTGADLAVLGDPDASLAAARQEAQDIAAQLPGSLVRLGDEVDRGLLSEGLEGRRALHLATHAWVDPQEPRRSGIRLSGGDTLTYGEIPGLAASLGELRLVVLSACESGLPAEGLDGTSIDGLAAQFRRAGVESLVASLWTVDDRSTRELMVTFYEALAGGTDLARALQQAQVELLQQRSTAHPWHWAPFVLVGDWR